MKPINFILILAISIIALSCTPDEFTLNKKTPGQIDGLIMTSLESVDQYADNAIILNENGLAAMRRYGLTQFIGDFTVKIQQGEGVRFSIRSACNEYDNHPVINFDYTTKGCIFSGTGLKEFLVDSVKALRNSPSRIKIYNLGKNITVTVNCDTVYNTKTELPATEFIMVKSLNNSRIQLSGISFEEFEDK
ncbi:MAG: hypothetical protein WCT77_07270 [Bacteroidota bacterium]